MADSKYLKASIFAQITLNREAFPCFGAQSTSVVIMKITYYRPKNRHFSNLLRAINWADTKTPRNCCIQTKESGDFGPSASDI